MLRVTSLVYGTGLLFGVIPHSLTPLLIGLPIVALAGAIVLTLPQALAFTLAPVGSEGAAAGLQEYPGIKLTGVDIEERQLAYARGHLERAGVEATLRQAGALALPFGDESFDHVWTMWFLHKSTAARSYNF